MINGINSKQVQVVETSGVNTAQIVNQAVELEAVTEAEIRRQMYERIAQGNALAEAEDTAQNQWRGR